MVPRAVLMKSSLVSFNTSRQNISKTAISVNTARQVNTAHLKTTVNVARPMSYLSKTAQSTVKRPINNNTSFKNSKINQRVNTVRGKNVNTARLKAIVNVVQGNNVNVVKASACWVWKPNTKVLDHDKRVIDSGCSRHMTRNMSYLTDYEEIDGRYVAFEGNPKGGKITRKGTIKTGNLDFENLIDESQVLLRVPRKNNMYSVDLKNIVPKRGLTCLFAKATSDESKLWHRRLGHLNFKTMNKLVKGNLVRGLPSILFENNETCVGCQKGKQHRASCKSKTENLIILPLHLFHMDMFGPTFLISLMKKMYCLVVTNDYSRFTWVFFLATKDETSNILKSFITGIENIVDHKVKVIICDNGTEFKNREMNEFCEMKGILRQFSVARTPQQNGVAKRRNKILIEAARTMLADSITPTLSFMRPFGCHVTILNIIDHLGKFDGKADKGFFVGYSLTSKAFRVFNSRTRIVEENLHIRFSESTLNVAGSGPDWLFDIDVLTRTMNYEPIVADLRKDSEYNDQEKGDNVNNTNNVNAASINEVNVVGRKTSIELPDDPNMPALEDYNIFDFTIDDEDDGVEADINNLDTTIQVSPNPTIRIHKDHPLDQDERGIMIRNKARLVAEGYTQEKGIDYDEVFASVTRIEAIMLFLAYASFKDFVVYQMDVKSAFLYEKIKEEVYVCQPPGFEDPDFPDRVYKMSSMGELTFFLGLQVQQKNDGIFISQDKHVGEILKKFGFTEVKTASTPMETQKPLLKDEDGEEIDVHMYRSMIGSLMYLTSSRPDIMFAVCARAKYQVNSKVSHLYAVKMIFRYLKSQLKLGLWYPKDSLFDLVAYTDSDYAGASLDKKSTIEGCQFLGSRLITC
ncbi:putative ribonuclease H-like domain-containing protein [Tanacetum coccineum]|uniref:Ribonuclease H-like domain-containing protein n=1 Tax=Tanacetum coccineum TaxID=301880 RepID=A0ABQ4Y644_9ASTR